MPKQCWHLYYTYLGLLFFFQPSKSHYRNVLQPVPGVLAWVSRLEIQERAPILMKLNLLLDIISQLLSGYIIQVFFSV